MLHDNVFIQDIWDQWNPQVSQGSTTYSRLLSLFILGDLSHTEGCNHNGDHHTDLLPVSRVIYPAATWTSQVISGSHHLALSSPAAVSEIHPHPNTTCSCRGLAPWKVDCIRDFLVLVPSPHKYKLKGDERGPGSVPQPLVVGWGLRAGVTRLTCPWEKKKQSSLAQPAEY